MTRRSIPSLEIPHPIFEAYVVSGYTSTGDNEYWVVQVQVGSTIIMEKIYSDAFDDDLPHAYDQNDATKKALTSLGIKLARLLED